jgi:NAD(P)-dependent dehydrogenase (short-subunit alcohol dehydrogenase family)
MTRITTPFGFSSTASEVAAGHDLTGKRVIVTGAASGIGVETARALAGIGADVTLAVRNLDAGAEVAQEIATSTGNSNLHVASLELADRGSIADFVAKWEGPLHILVNNAGVMAMPEAHTPQGWEMQFAVNHLGHFALSLGLHNALVAADGARVVSVSSGAHMNSPIVFDDIHFAFRTYEPWSAYGQSKTANVLFAVEAAKRWAQDGIAVNALMPGVIRTNLQRHVGNITLPADTWKTTEQGAATSVLLAVSSLVNGVTGRYFADCNEAELVSHRPTELPASLNGLAPYAIDSANAERLWEMSLEMLAST